MHIPHVIPQNATFALLEYFPHPQHALPLVLIEPVVYSFVDCVSIT